jgi:hypothetical protein
LVKVAIEEMLSPIKCFRFKNQGAIQFVSSVILFLVGTLFGALALAGPGGLFFKQEMKIWKK